MHHTTRVCVLAAALLCGACLFPGAKGPQEDRNAGFFQDYSLLRPARPVQQAYVDPNVDLKSFRSLRVLDFENYTGKEVDPQALTLIAETVTHALESLSPADKPFALLDRSPKTAAAWVDLVLEGAVTTYQVKSENASWSRMSDQVIVGIECRLVQPKSGHVVAMIRTRAKRKAADITDVNPVRQAIEDIGRDVAAFLAHPDLDGGSGRSEDRSEDRKDAGDKKDKDSKKERDDRL